MKPETPLDVTIMVGEDLTRHPKPAKIEFRVICSNVSSDNKLSVTLNGEPLPDPHQPDEWQLEYLGASHVWKSATAFTTQLEPNQLVLGHNKAGLTIGEGEIIGRAFEIYVSY